MIRQWFPKNVSPRYTNRNIQMYHLVLSSHVLLNHKGNSMELSARVSCQSLGIKIGGNGQIVRIDLHDRARSCQYIQLAIYYSGHT